jgi:hypothetical protein
MPGEDPDPREGGPDPQAQAHAAQQAQAQRDFDRDRLTSSITEAMSCLEFIALTTRHLLDLLAQADPMEREYLKQNLVVNDSGQELALRLADAVLPGTGGEVIQMSPRDGTPRGSALDAEYLRSRVVQMQGCGAFVRDTFEGVLKETASLTPEEYQFLLQNLGIGEREFAVAETLISGALGRASEEVGQEDQKAMGPNKTDRMRRNYVDKPRTLRFREELNDPTIKVTDTPDYRYSQIERDPTAKPHDGQPRAQDRRYRAGDRFTGTLVRPRETSDNSDVLRQKPIAEGTAAPQPQIEKPVPRSSIPKDPYAD